MQRQQNLTKNQKIVLDIIEKSTEPLKAYSILSNVKKKGINAPPQVYRALDKLVDMGKIHKIESKNAFVACQNSNCKVSKAAAFSICESCEEVTEIDNSKISKYLNLNDDLAETLSLAHDLGHTPFGHAGEEVLNDCMSNHGGFDHNLQTLRIVMFIEKKYIDFDGLNLSFETLDGLIKHNGPIKDLSKLENIIGTKSLKNKFKLNKFSCLESQISNIADDIAYNNHDIQDGLKAGLFTLEELLEINFFKDIYKKYKDKKKIELQVLIHQIIRDSIDLMVKDIINNTIQNIKKNKIKKLNNVFDNKQKTVEFSDKLKDIDFDIRSFLRKNMYDHKDVQKRNDEGKKIVNFLFKKLHGDTNNNFSIQNFDQNKSRSVADFISGMTDRYAINLYEELK